LGLTNKQNIFWKVKWIAIVWGIWYHRNRVIFNYGKVDMEEVWCLAQLNT